MKGRPQPRHNSVTPSSSPDRELGDVATRTCDVTIVRMGSPGDGRSDPEPAGDEDYRIELSTMGGTVRIVLRGSLSSTARSHVAELREVAACSGFDVEIARI